MDLGHRGPHLGAAILFALPLGDDPQDDRGAAGVDPYAGDAAAADEIGQERFDLAFAGAKALDVPPQNDAAAAAQPTERRKQISIPHLPHFRRNAGQGKEPATTAIGPRNVEVDPGRGAVRIRHDAAPFREIGLKLVALGHFPLPPGEEPPHVLQGLGHEKQGAPGRRGQRLAGEVVGRRPQPAGGDDKVRPLERQAEDVNARLQLVADRRVVQDADTQLAQALAEPLRVGVEELSAGDFVADSKDLGV